MIIRKGHNPGEQRGSPIPNSRMFRDWCRACGEAIRMSAPQNCDGNNRCDECIGAATKNQRTTQMWQYLTPRQQIGKAKTA